VAELKFAVIGNVFATIDYDWRHNTSVPAGTVHTDTITSINFGYTFGKKPG
jgi:putative salt-induced outer membrane protein YdiY